MRHLGQNKTALQFHIFYESSITLKDESHHLKKNVNCKPKIFLKTKYEGQYFVDFNLNG